MNKLGKLQYIEYASPIFPELEEAIHETVTNIRDNKKTKNCNELILFTFIHQLCLGILNNANIDSVLTIPRSYSSFRDCINNFIEIWLEQNGIEEYSGRVLDSRILYSRGRRYIEVHFGYINTFYLTVNGDIKLYYDK